MEAQQSRRLLLNAAQPAPDASQQNAKVTGFCEIVVRTAIQAANDVFRTLDAVRRRMGLVDRLLANSRQTEKPSLLGRFIQDKEIVIIHLGLT
ncbi:MAG: hypothetical protein JO108_14945 [Acidobacteriaceae bacterium]|nr:hypothetical protein [Acidobacteriaceae bacterium]